MLIPLVVTVRVPGVPVVPAAWDAQGNPVLGPDVVTTSSIKAFAPRSGSSASASIKNVTDFGPAIITGGFVYGYSGDVIPANAVITIRGVEYHVDGEVGDWSSPYSNAPDGIEFAVKRAS